MLPAPTLESIAKRPADLRQVNADGHRLVSILFATPDTAVLGDLQQNAAYFNARSGHMWDLYVAGYYAYGGKHYDRDGFPVGMGSRQTGKDGWWFSPARFLELRLAAENAHARCLRDIPVLRGRRRPWQYSGSPELVNLWAFGSYCASTAADTASGVMTALTSGFGPQFEWNIEWESLTAHVLGGDQPPSLSNVVETHTGWATRSLGREFRPGTRPRVIGDVLHADELRRGLSWIVAGAAGAALTEGVSELVQALTHH
jgi:hypothetical protein